MEDSATRNIVAVVATDKNTIIETGVPAFLAPDTKVQEKIASEIARILGGNVYCLSNGVIIITQD